MRTQFLKEAELLSLFSHSMIPKLYEVFETTEYCFLVQEYVEGEDLETYVLHHDVSAHFCIMIGLKLCDFFSYLLFFEKRAVFYMDMKPEHMIICEDSVKVIDYGAVLDLTDKGRDSHLFGNREYDAPEIAIAKTADERSAVYAIGAILSFLLRYADVHVSKEFRNMIKTACSKDPKKRQQTIALLDYDLRRERELLK